MSEKENMTQKDFDNMIESGINLVDFNAPWCGPCRAQDPILEEVQKTFDGKATIAKINIEKNQEVANQLGILSIPTLILFKEGKEMTRFVGLQDAKTLDQAISSLM
jgi:thioredoxin 1